MEETRRTMFSGTVKTAAALAATLIMVVTGATACRAQAEKPVSYLTDEMSRLPPEAGPLYPSVTKPLWPGELGYREIPWLVDLNEGIKAAREENRPLLLWTSGDEPL